MTMPQEEVASLVLGWAIEGLGACELADRRATDGFSVLYGIAGLPAPRRYKVGPRSVRYCLSIICFYLVAAHVRAKSVPTRNVDFDSRSGEFSSHRWSR